MQVRANPDGPIGSCGCGRSPTGDCCGWHGLTEDAYKKALADYELKQYQKQANDLWFKDGSCTGGKSE